MWETRVWSLSQEDPLAKERATHSSTLAWKIRWTEEPGRLQSMGHKESDTTEQLNFFLSFLSWMHIHRYGFHFPSLISLLMLPNAQPTATRHQSKHHPFREPTSHWAASPLPWSYSTLKVFHLHWNWHTLSMCLPYLPAKPQLAGQSNSKGCLISQHVYIEYTALDQMSYYTPKGPCNDNRTHQAYHIEH